MKSCDITYLDFQGWLGHRYKTGEKLHVFLDGQDVTSGCFRVAFHMSDGPISTRSEIADVWHFKRNAEGNYYIDPETGKAAEEMRTGVVSIRPGADIDPVMART